MSSIVVKYSDIEDSCRTLETLAGDIDSSAEELNTLINNIPENWQGDAGDNYYEKIRAFYTDLLEAKQTIAMSVLYLASCAGAYDTMDQDSFNNLIGLVGGFEAINAVDINSLPEVNLYERFASQFNENSNNNRTNEANDGNNGTASPENGYNQARGNNSSGGGNWSGSLNYGYPAIPFVNSNFSSSSGAMADPGIAINSGSNTANTTSVNYLGNVKVDIPSSVIQGGYTVTGYDRWINSGNEMNWASGTAQYTISELWKKQGRRDIDGIAVVNIDGVDRYLVALSPKYGKAGDLVDIELENGQIIKAVIADEKGSDAGSEWGHVLEDGSINLLEFEVTYDAFVIEHNRSNPNTTEWGLDWDSSSPVVSITNNGTIADSDGNIIGNIDANNNVTSAQGTVTTALDWAQNIANDNSHGYSQDNRQGPNYDCSSFVINAYKNAGVDTGSASYTGDMVQGLTSTGQFEYVTGNPYQNGTQLQPGDILFRQSNGSGHTEIYVGDGKTIGAKSNYDGLSGDSSGNEISIHDDTNASTWEGYFRYVPKTKII